MADRSRRRTLTRLALIFSAAASLGLGGPAAFGFEGGHGGHSGDDGGGSHLSGGGGSLSGSLSGLGAGLGGAATLSGSHGGSGDIVAPGSAVSTDGLSGDRGGPGGGDSRGDHGAEGGLNVLTGHGLLDPRSGRESRGGDHGLNLGDDSGKGEGAGGGHGRGGTVERAARAVADEATAAITQSRQAIVRRLLRDHADLVEADPFGQPVVRGEVLAVSPSAAALAKARKAGFGVGASEDMPGLGLKSVVLLAPRGTSAPEALRRIRALDPDGQYDLNHLYQVSGKLGRQARAASRPARAPAVPSGPGLRVGLVDGAVPPRLPALAGTRIVQRGFAPGRSVPSAHATAVASLLVGRKPPFLGAAPGATLYVADVYGSTAAGGSAEAIAHALGWLAEMRAPVINVSLVGPPNLLLAAAVKALIARGQLVVAAVGNDGPAAPPLYPASYPGVVAVTGVDAHRRILPEAGRASHIDFAAPGSDMAAAGLDGGFISVRGTSFAAPIAAGLLARLEPEPSPAAAARALNLLGRRAVDAGPPGPDSLYGRGLVGLELRTPPATVHARLALKGP